MKKPMKRIWILTLGWMLITPWALSAQTALSVEENSLWRVDLETREVEWLAGLGTPDQAFSCADLAVSPSGEIRCVHDLQLYSIVPGGSTALADLPPGLPSALTFDSQGRLWFSGGPDSMLWQLDPFSGAVLESSALTLEGNYVNALAARGERLFAFTDSPHPEPKRLEEIDLSTGGSLSSIDVEPFGIYGPQDADFDAEGDLWVTSFNGSIILGLFSLSFHRIQLDPLAETTTWSGLVFIGNPWFTNIGGIQLEGSLVEVPALGPAGLAILSLLLVGAAWFVLRRAPIRRDSMESQPPASSRCRSSATCRSGSSA